MITERLHEHIVQELQQNGRSEVVFVVVAIVLNLVTTSINAGLAGNKEKSASMAVMAVLLLLVVVINLVVIAGLRKGREIKAKLLNGLLRLYDDEKVADYYDTTLLDAYQSRFGHYLIGVLATGVVAFVVPLIILALD